MLPLTHEEHKLLLEKKVELLQTYLTSMPTQGAAQEYDTSIKNIDRIIEQRGSLCPDCVANRNSQHLASPPQSTSVSLSTEIICTSLSTT